MANAEDSSNQTPPTGGQGSSGGAPPVPRQEPEDPSWQQQAQEQQGSGPGSGSSTPVGATSTGVVIGSGPAGESSTAVEVTSTSTAVEATSAGVGSSTPVGATSTVEGGSSGGDGGDRGRVQRKRTREGDAGAGSSRAVQDNPPPAAEAYRYQCSLCPLRFLTDRALCGHMRNHPRTWTGAFPPPVFSREEFLEEGVGHLLNPLSEDEEEDAAAAEEGGGGGVIEEAAEAEERVGGVTEEAATAAEERVGGVTEEQAAAVGEPEIREVEKEKDSSEGDKAGGASTSANTNIPDLNVSAHDDDGLDLNKSPAQE